MSGDGCSYDHVDFRVRDLRRLTPFYDALMPALGFSVIKKSSRSREYYRRQRWMPFFSVVLGRTSTPSKSRIAFCAPTRKDVDRIASVARRAGAKRIEGPQVCTNYTQPYYAVFFDDADGNKFEVCCRR